MRTQPRSTARYSAQMAGICCFAALSACMKQPAPDASDPAVTATDATLPDSESSAELNWARAALQRNPTLEIIATDTAAGVFTVRFKDSGEVRAVKLAELAAAPIASLVAPTRTAATPPAPADAATPVASSNEGLPNIARSMSASATPATNYTIERTEGQLKVSGPGVSIVSTGPATMAGSASASAQRSSDPIICEGRRMLHFDNRNIYVEGDAIIARGGCELYITNSRIVATGTGVVVRGAVVHIANSTIEGSAASFDADDTSKVYLRTSTFGGLPRRSERAVVQDQGSNQWR